MNPEVTQVEPMPNYRLKIWFENNETREFDTTPFLDKGIFKELRNESYFKQVRVAFGAIEWPNHQDFRKDTLYLLSSPTDT